MHIGSAFVSEKIVAVVLLSIVVCAAVSLFCTRRLISTYLLSMWPEGRQCWWIGVTAALVAGVLGAFILFESANPHAIDFARIFYASLVISVPLLLVSWFFVWRETRNARYGKWCFALFVLLFSLPVLATVETATEVVNRVVDSSAPEIHRQVIWGKDYGRNPNAPGHYFFWVEWWNRPGQPIEILRVDKSNYDRAIPRRSILRLRSHPGALGYEWIESFELEKE
jgi:hypothetical protein